MNNKIGFVVLHSGFEDESKISARLENEIEYMMESH